MKQSSPKLREAAETAEREKAKSSSITYSFAQCVSNACRTIGVMQLKEHCYYKSDTQQFPKARRTSSAKSASVEMLAGMNSLTGWMRGGHGGRGIHGRRGGLAVVGRPHIVRPSARKYPGRIDPLFTQKRQQPWEGIIPRLLASEMDDCRTPKICASSAWLRHPQIVNTRCKRAAASASLSEKERGLP